MSSQKKKRAAAERRKSQRLDISIKTKYRQLAKKKLLEEIFTQNISGGGAGLRLAKPLPKGARIKTMLHFPDDPKPITAVSEVIWCKKVKKQKLTYYDTGIRHLKILPKDRERFVFLFCETMINYFIVGKAA